MTFCVSCSENGGKASSRQILRNWLKTSHLLVLDCFGQLLIAVSQWDLWTTGCGGSQKVHGSQRKSYSELASLEFEASPVSLKLFESYSWDGCKTFWTLFLGLQASRRYLVHVLGQPGLVAIRVPSSAAFWTRLKFLTVRMLV